MGAPEDLLDLDFTSFVPAPAAAAPGAARPREEAMQIGASTPGRVGNLVFYARSAGAAAAGPANDGPILVVEDDEVTRKVLEKLLERRGLPARGAIDGRALAQSLRQPPLPRLILLDVGLPKVSGFRVLELLRQNPMTSAIPVIMVTASAENRDIQRGLSLGAEGFLSKPLTAGTLYAAIGKVLRQAA